VENPEIFSKIETRVREELGIADAKKPEDPPQTAK
jgi:hypothetical protein